MQVILRRYEASKIGNNGERFTYLLTGTSCNFELGFKQDQISSTLMPLAHLKKIRLNNRGNMYESKDHVSVQKRPAYRFDSTGEDRHTGEIQSLRTRNTLSFNENLKQMVFN